jgi:phage-related protein
MDEIRRPLYWEGSSKKYFKEFPVPVQKDMGIALFVVQLGGMPESAKPWTGLGSGVYELAEDHRGDTFRAVYTVRIGDAVHVLHAFQKKSKSGIATPRLDVQLIQQRLKTVLARYEASGRTRWVARPVLRRGPTTCWLILASRTQRNSL